MAKFRANKYEVIRGIWKGIAVPSLMYGMNVVNWTNGDMTKLEIVQNKIARLALGSNQMTAVVALSGDMGWSSFEERFMKGRLNYKARIDAMDEDRWVKIISIFYGCRGKWVKSCSRMINRVGLHKTWQRIGGSNQWHMVMYPEDRKTHRPEELKVILKNKIEEYWLKKWQEG